MSAANETEQTRPQTVLLVGRHNGGKTSTLMHLTGARHTPVNFPGSSVERAEGTVTLGGNKVNVVDLPGIASLSAISHDEEVTVNFLRDAKKSNTTLCVVLDATKLSVEFGLLKDLAQLGLPAVLALTKNDLARDLGAPVDIVQLAQEFGVPVVEVDGLRGRGFDRLKESLERSFAEPRAVEADFDPVDCAARISPPVAAQTLPEAAARRESRENIVDIVDMVAIARYSSYS